MMNEDTMTSNDNDEPIVVPIETLLSQSLVDISEHVWNAHRLTNGLIGSQKASALAAYMRSSSIRYTAPQTLFLILEDDPEEVVNWVLHHVHGNADLFTRTCPLNPRHGVLESTRCDQSREAILETVSGLQQVMRDMDPEGCLMVQPFIECVGSAVLAPSMYVVCGEDHDGVTASHGFSLTFPLNKHNNHFKHVLGNMSQQTGHEYDPELHEIEMVFDIPMKDSCGETAEIHDYSSSLLTSGCKTTLTQIRGCDEHIRVEAPPAGVSINGAVPSGTVVTSEVWTMTGLERVVWLEENITAEKCPEGFVVSDPNGSLLSHICAHCRTHGVPYIIGEVSEGETWTEASSGWVVENSEGLFEAQPYNPFDYIESFRSGIKYGNIHWRRKHAYFSTFFHQWMGQPINDPALTAFLAGIFASWMVKASLAACLGEMRHARGQKRNRLPDCSLFINSILGSEFSSAHEESGEPMSSRSHYHTWMRETVVDWEGAAAVLALCEKLFKTGWGSSYGGKKWGSGSASACKVASLIAEVCDEDMADDGYLSDTLGPALVGAVNELENAQHNNGNLLNKFGNDIKEVYNFGTQGFSETQLDAVFLTYTMAKDVVQDALEEATLQSQNDWLAVCEWLSPKTAKFWRANPLYSTAWSETDMPEGVIESVDIQRNFFNSWGDMWTHAKSSHSYGNYNDSSFVPCGHESCGRCMAWAKIDNPLEMVSVGSPTVQMEVVDVWVMEDGTYISKVLKPRIINTLRAMVEQGDTVSISQVVDAYAKVVEKDCVETAEKHLGQILYQFNEVDFVLLMKAIAAVKEGHAKLEGAQA